jgi:hypothetical protein
MTDRSNYVLQQVYTVLGSAAWVWFLIWLYEVVLE